ncbi:MAG: hypothetical protein ACRBN8_28675 [Nannocystales bacterium]
MRRVSCLVVCLAGCASSPVPAPSTPEPSSEAVTPGPEARSADPTERLLKTEEALGERDIRVRMTVHSDGAVDSTFVGALVMQGDRVALTASGSFAGTPVELSFEADGERMRGKGGAREFDLPQPPGLRDVLAVSLVRMGILHTLAMLSAGQPPDVPEGDVRDWLVVTPQPGAPTVAVMEPFHPDLPTDPVTFRTAVAGEESVTATVWIEDSILVERQQETRFGEETMRVLEAFEPM